MKIRKAKESDKKIILKLLNQNSGNTADDKLHYKEKHADEYIRGKAFRTFVAEIDGKVIGIIMANVFPIAEYAEVYNLAVDEGNRRKGIGIKLMDFVEKKLKKSGIEFVYGYINEDNISSQKLMEKLGYNRGKKLLFYSKILK